MESLVRIYGEAESTHTSEVKSAWLHHRFTQIHPFQDGNGRVARALATLVFLRDGLFPLVVRESDRSEYIGALETADAGNLGPLVGFFARRQRDSILKALGLEQQVQQSNFAEQIFASALEVLRGRFNHEQQKVSVVYEHAKKLTTNAFSEFRRIAGEFDRQLRELTPPNRPKYQARSNTADSASNQRHYFYREIIETAKRFDYFANFEHFRSWVRLTFTTDREFDYVISFHGYGPGETGILAVSAFSYIKAPREEGGFETVSLHPAATELFQFNYAEPFDSIEKRFFDWLQASIAIALAEWKRSLQAGM